MSTAIADRFLTVFLGELCQNGYQQMPEGYFKMSHDTSGQPGFRSRFLAIRTSLVVLSMLGLLVSNVASLVSASAHDWMHSALARVLAIGGMPFADRALSDSPKARIEQTVRARTHDLETRNRHLTAVYQDQARQLEQFNVRNRQLAHQLEVSGKHAKDTAATVHRRLAKGVSRNLAALPAESVPYLGIGVTLAVTSLDLYDACQTMKDFNTLLTMMGQGQENPELCGQKVPTMDQVLSSARSGWRTSVESVAQESRAMKIPVPQVRLPTRPEQR
jgi:hypothetical protein